MMFLITSSDISVWRMKQNKLDFEKTGIAVIFLQMRMINKIQCNTLYLPSLILHLSTY